MSAARLILKQPNGWFAAGREVAQALALLSDAAFKLYMQLCLEAERHTGRVRIDLAALASTLRKDAESLEALLGELHDHNVCERRGHRIEICDRFWPYQKQAGGAMADSEADFIRQVKEAFLKPACVRSRFTAADEKLAVNLCRRGVDLERVRRAISLGCARKYMAMLNGQPRLPITSLVYFAYLIDEVAQPHIPASYWDHVRRRAEEMEKSWIQTANPATPADDVPSEPSPPAMI
jgi:hypothetical protein